MDPCSLPTATTSASTSTSIAQAVSARRAAQRASLRNRATASASGSSSEAAPSERQQDMSLTRSALLEGELQGPPSIPLTEMLPLMQLHLYRQQPNREGRRPVPPRRLLTNEDIIATIDEVLAMVGDGEDALPPNANNQDSRSILSHQPLHS